ncbi:MAG: electron transfer flavoprotein-ubiquinone oxidoreductase [Candidatus Brocadiae bacterium]|nr:electron transfer flavoprotein-ubiquinone oxidoreductase [Candidatus Brocadiia bacterium]
MAERETLETDVLIVGAGPAGLAAALHLHKLLQDAKASGAAPELSIMVIEKASEVGAHILSGAVMDPRAMDELWPGWKAEAPVEGEVTSDDMYFLTKKGKYPVPFVPPAMHNKGNTILSLNRFVRWMGKKVEEKGIDLFTGFPGAEPILEGARLCGVRTGDKGLDKDGKPKSNFEAGMDIRAKVTILAEGTRGSLTKVVVNRLALQGENPQIYSTGVKEIWRLKEGRFPAGKVVHTMGWPLGINVYGGSFAYGMKDNLLSLGLVVPLDLPNPLTDPQWLLQELKSHPYFRGILEGGELLRYGGKTIPEGGWWSQPRMAFDGGMIVGDAAGALNAQRLKGIHLAIKSGMLAAETALEALKKGDTGASTLAAYPTRWKESWAGKELWGVRNFRQGFQGGFIAGGFHYVLQQLTGGRGLHAIHPVQEDHTHVRPAVESNLAGEVWLTLDDRPAKKPPGEHSVDKLSDVYLSGTKHEENQPCHLKVADTSICATKCRETYGNPCMYFCPAQVYEMTRQKDGSTKLHINASNCVHCKTCDIADPYGIITWVTPEGGGGPQYTDL